MDIFGSPPINKYLYFSGKFSAYIIWICLLLQLLGINIRLFQPPDLLLIFSQLTVIIGLILFVVSSFNLGSSLRFGIPKENTAFKIRGLYAISRNPMYFGFFLMTIGAIAYTANLVIVIAGIYGIYIHHRIVLAEEKYLEIRFGQQYIDYCKRVKRYLL